MAGKPNPPHLLSLTPALIRPSATFSQREKEEGEGGEQERGQPIVRFVFSVAGINPSRAKNDPNYGLRPFLFLGRRREE